MAKPILILEDFDEIRPTDYIRPLREFCGSFGESFINEKSCYGGGLMNHFKWVRVSDKLGKCWYGRKIADLYEGPFTKSEFARGDIPKENIATLNIVNGSKEWSL